MELASATGQVTTERRLRVWTREDSLQFVLSLSPATLLYVWLLSAEQARHRTCYHHRIFDDKSPPSLCGRYGPQPPEFRGDDVMFNNSPPNSPTHSPTLTHPAAHKEASPNQIPRVPHNYNTLELADVPLSTTQSFSTPFLDRGGGHVPDPVPALHWQVHAYGAHLVM